MLLSCRMKVWQLFLRFFVYLFNSAVATKYIIMTERKFLKKFVTNPKQVSLIYVGGEKVESIEELYQMYFKDVFLYVKALSKDEHVAEDITQETFFKAMKGIGSFKGECDIRVWLCQIAKNAYYTYCRKRKRIEEEAVVEEEHATEQSSIESRLLDKEQAVALHKILHHLEEPYKEVFHLRIFGELSFREIGEVFGKTESWSRVTFHRAKVKIMERL